MQNLTNFRDLGGYETKDGKKVVTGKLFRSGEIVDLDPKDKEAFLHDYQIKTIIDLRGASEIAESPNDTLAGTETHTIDIMRDAQGSSAGVEDMKKTKLSPTERMRRIYRDIILSESGQKGYQEFFEILAEEESSPIIFHCFAGKDRTGIAAALIFEILGVAREDIYADYLLTNKKRAAANDEILAEFKAQGATDAQVEGMHTMLSVKKEYLEIAYELIEENFDSVQNYLTNVLNVTPQMQDKIREFYTE